VSIPKSKYQLEYLARMNVIYHESREVHFLRCNRWASFATILLSSTAVVSLSDLPGPKFLQGSGHAVALILGFVVTVFTAAALAFDWNGQLSTHSKLKSKWMNLALEAGLLQEGDRPSFERLVRQLAALNAEEPPPVESALKQAEALTDVAFGRLGNG
jgi:hypothetical protein